MAERVSEQPVIDVATRKDFMYFIDKEGYVARAPYANNKLTPEEKAKREAEAKAKREALIVKYTAEGAKLGLPAPGVDDNLMEYKKAIAQAKAKIKKEEQKAKLQEKLAKLEF